ncbi:hypothetical protein DIPPA_35527 [Diplonema papillatum]|nr:hypothetical protein DIPPA_35527 [Diplonema papillatum]
MLAHHDVEKLAPALREFDVTVSIQQLRETRLTGVAPLGTEEHEKQWRDSMHENFGNWLRARRAYLSFIPYMGEATERQQAIMCDKKLTPKQIAAELKANGMTASVEQIVEAHTSGEVADAPYDGFLVWFLRCCKLVDYQSLIEQDDVAKFEKVVSNSDEEVTPAAVKRIASNANAKTV